MKKYISLFIIAGSVHALFSLYWGLGGEAGLITVGSWVFTLSAQSVSYTHLDVYKRQS